MIVKLLVDTEINGVLMKAEQKVAVTRAVAIELCRDEKAVAPIDVPCEKRHNTERFDVEEVVEEVKEKKSRAKKS